MKLCYELWVNREKRRGEFSLMILENTQNIGSLLSLLKESSKDDTFVN